jgi:hypothetical protein
MPNLIDDREDRECNACEQQAVLGGRRAALVGGKVCKQGVKRIHIRMSLSAGSHPPSTARQSCSLTVLNASSLFERSYLQVKSNLILLSCLLICIQGRSSVGHQPSNATLLVDVDNLQMITRCVVMPRGCGSCALTPVKIPAKAMCARFGGCSGS